MVIPEDLRFDVLNALLETHYNPEATQTVLVSSESDRQYLKTALGYISAVIPEASLVEVTLGSIH